MTSIQMPGGREVQLPHLEAHENSDARRKWKGSAARRQLSSAGVM